MTGNIRKRAVFIHLLFALFSFGQNPNQIRFPVEAEILVEGVFPGCEGIAFNGEGRLFVTGGKALWEVDTSGRTRKVSNLITNLGIAGIGKKDILVADFGKENAFQKGRNNDGIIWRVTPDGKKTKLVDGKIGDPNFILVLEDRSFLVSDDATNEIFKVDLNGNVNLYCTAVNHPNGLALSKDGNTLYIAQIFSNIRPIIPDNRIWSVRIKDGNPLSGAVVMTTSGPNGANDGLAVDKLGRIYIAANGEGKIWRYDPSTDRTELIVENVHGVASIVFGEGNFDAQSIYFTTTYAGGRGGKVYRAQVGVEGLPQYR